MNIVNEMTFITPDSLLNVKDAVYEPISCCEIEGGRHFEHLLWELNRGFETLSPLETARDDVSF
jgi:hypothetical protein